MKRWMKLALALAVMMVCAAVSAAWDRQEAFAATGFYVSGASLKDANGNTFVMRGVNSPHIWYDTQAYNALSTISADKANTVRIVWSTSGTADRLRQIIDRCKQLGLIGVVELHDATGSNSAAALNNEALYYAQSDVKQVLIDNAKYVLVNIANEWGDGNLTDTAWRDAYKTAVSTIRSAGIPNTIVIDSPGWGQNSAPVKSQGQALLTYDPNHNLMFSIHMYGSWNDAGRIGTELQAIQNLGLAVMVGEFGYNYNNGNNNLGSQVNAQEVMNQCQSKGIGYLAWSWTGNDSANAWLDLTSSGDWTTLTSWGNLVFNGTNGIKATSAKASVFNGASSGTELYGFEGGSSQGWTGSGVAGGPWAVSEWSSSGSYALKADVTLGGSQYYLLYAGANNFGGKSKLTAVVKHAAWGSVGTGMQAKLYIKTGSGYAWYDGGAVSINSSGGTTLALNLSGIANLGDVRELGVQFLSPSGSSGGTSVYVDNVAIQ